MASDNLTNDAAYITLGTGETSLVLACAKGARPHILYWGERLTSTAPQQLAIMATRQHAPGSADTEIAASLLNETGSGISGQSGFVAHRAGKDWATLFTVASVERLSENAVRIICHDTQTHIGATHQVAIDPESDLLTWQTTISNSGDEPLLLDWCAAACLPLDQRTDRLISFTGRWAGEFATHEVAPFQGAYVRENKSGRTSHDNFPGLIVAAPHTTETNGRAFGFHLGWSGNHRTRVDRLADGRAFLQMGEYFFPGEITLAPGETYETPCLHAGFSNHGLSALSRKFHTHVRRSVMDGRITSKPRPVHYNTWEALYFDHDSEKLFALAEAAAGVGAERFVLDDGWFAGRRNDRTGLGDWWVSEEVYPDGLVPLIEKVKSLGMEFGLWFEPEMVNPDSELFRQHPDWVLNAEGRDQIPFRGQFALDLTKAEVTDYLYTCIHNILTAHDISYIKWDMNRDIHHPGSAGKAVTSGQTRALYALIARIRDAHPTLEIESCASGGGRADYGILTHTDRIWTSDSNDALDRQYIQRGASHFFPPEIMGAHVGPAKCHITGRRLSMAMRVGTAFMGHMGMELNLLKESPKDLTTLKAGIALHKLYRALLHTGDLARLDTPEHVIASGVVSKDKSEAVFSWANIRAHRETLPGRIFFTGLDAHKVYRIKIIWPAPATSRSTPSIISRADLSADGILIPGEALMQMGLQAPLLNPETCLLFSLTAE